MLALMAILMGMWAGQGCPAINGGPLLSCHTPRHPFEHVIEIRTKRDEYDITVPARPAPKGSHWSKFCAQGYQAQVLIADDGLVHERLVQCVKVNETFYIDGQKFGTIKETEEK